jgi:hypothetical protein
MNASYRQKGEAICAVAFWAGAINARWKGEATWAVFGWAHLMPPADEKVKPSVQFLRLWVPAPFKWR